MPAEERPQFTPVAMNAVPGQIPPPPPVFTETPQIATGRPVSVIVIAILFFVGALFEFFGIFSSGGSTVSDFVNRIDSITFCVVNTIIGIGLLQWRSAARAGAIITLIVRYITSIPLTIWSLQDTDIPSEIPSVIVFGVFGFLFLIAGVYYGVLIYFLTRPAVKAACSR